MKVRSQSRRYTNSCSEMTGAIAGNWSTNQRYVLQTCGCRFAVIQSLSVKQQELLLPTKFSLLTSFFVLLLFLCLLLSGSPFICGQRVTNKEAVSDFICTKSKIKSLFHFAPFCSNLASSWDVDISAANRDFYKPFYCLSGDFFFTPVRPTLKRR